MDDFLKQFKENLDQQPTPEYQPADWEKLASRLDQEGTPSSNSTWGWFLGTMLFLLVGSNFYFFQQLDVANQKLTALEVQIDSTTQNLHSASESQLNLQSFTPHSNSSNNQEKSIQTELNITSPASTQKEIPPRFNTQQSTKIESPLKKNKPLAFSNNNISNSEIPSQQIQKEETNSNQYNPIEPQHRQHSIPKINISDTSSIQVIQTPAEDLMEESVKSNELPSPSAHFWPSQFSIATYAGAGFATNWNFDHSYTLQYGVQAHFHFSSSWSLFTNLDFTHLDYSVSEMDRMLGVTVIQFDQDDLSLQGIDVNRTIRSFDIGLQYQLLRHARLRPLLGASLGSSSLTQNEVRYRFLTLNTGQSMSEKYHWQEVDHQRFTSIKAGLNWQWTKHLHLGFESTYIHRFEHADHQLPNLFQGRIQMRYQF